MRKGTTKFSSEKERKEAHRIAQKKWQLKNPEYPKKWYAKNKTARKEYIANRKRANGIEPRKKLTEQERVEARRKARKEWKVRNPSYQKIYKRKYRLEKKIRNLEKPIEYGSMAELKNYLAQGGK
jgi:hypothetical protein